MLNIEQKRPELTWLDGAGQLFESGNSDLVVPTTDLLRRIVEDPVTHARLLNTLSMLEHMGSHKIMATQHSAAIDQATLRHVAEEAHHAYFMKRQAEKVAGAPLDYRDDELLAAPNARMYFQRLEAGMVHRIPAGSDARAAYLFMSMIVEFRALWFYRIYQQVLKKVGLPISLKRILGEEQNHLVEMTQSLIHSGELDDDRADDFLSIEQRLYSRMLAAMARAIDPSVNRSAAG